MKKIVIGLAVLGIYGLYTLGLRHQYPIIGGLKSKTASGASSSNNPGSSGPSTQPSASSSPPANYSDGSYTGSAADAFYGNVQVSVTISSGRITDVKFLQYPDTHSTSVFINQQAMPMLKQEAIASQSANVQIISGATFTSQAFIESLTSALKQA